MGWTIAVDARPGEWTRVGPLLRWYLPELAPGARASLRLRSNVARVGTGRSRVCALLVSGASPLEYCTAFRVISEREAAESGALSEAEALANLDDLAAPIPTAQPEGGPLARLYPLQRGRGIRFKRTRGKSVWQDEIMVIGTWTMANSA